MADEAFGVILRDLRRRARLTQEALAERASLSVRGISDLERGRRRAPQRATVEQLLQALAPDEKERGDLLAAAAAARTRLQPVSSEAPGEPGRAGHGPGLPMQLTPFFGRGRERELLRPLVLEQRLVSLVGTAGVGKTRLALQVAGDLSDSFPGGAHLVDLEPVGEQRPLSQVIGRFFDITEADGGDLARALRLRLGREPLLLVLDTCEHLLQPVARFVDDSLRACPGLCILATSRERLGVPGEVVWAVDPLEVPRSDRRYTAIELAAIDSAALFVDRARRARARFAITDEDAGSVAELLRRLEGLPLAIELAASWSGTLDPAGMVERLDHPLSRLTARYRVASPRHASLRAAVESSYQALDGEERSLYRRLGVFADGWTLESMAAVSGLQVGSELDLLTRLVDRSLVTAQTGPGRRMRYRMLNTLRDHALEKLHVEGELERTRAAFTAYCLRVAESVAGRVTVSGGRAALELLDAEHGNCVAALDGQPPPDVTLRLSIALADYWRLRGHYTMARQRLQAAVARTRARTSDLARALHNLGMMAFLQADRTDAMRFTRRAMAVSRRAADAAGELRSLEQLARIQFVFGDRDAARRCLQRGVPWAERLADPGILASYHLLLGQMEVVDGRPDRGLEHLTRSTESARRAGDAELSALACVAAGRLQVLEDRPALATPLLLEALTAVTAFGGPRHVAPVLEALAAVAADQGDHLRTATLAGAAWALHERAGSAPPTSAPLRGQLAIRWQRALSAPDARRAYADATRMSIAEAVQFALA